MVAAGKDKTILTGWRGGNMQRTLCVLAGLSVVLMLVQGCACQRETVYVQSPPVETVRETVVERPVYICERDYSIPINAEMLQKTALEAAQLVAASPALAQANNVAVASLERIDIRDVPVQAKVEDALLEALDIAGIRTLERDPDVMLRLVFQEGTPTIERLLLPHETVSHDAIRDYFWLEGIDSPAVVRRRDGTVETERVPRPGHELLDAHTFDYDQPLHVLDPRTEGVLKARLATADYLVGYRVLEHGLQYRDTNKTVGSERVVKRHALTRLHVRIVNAKTGAVVWARTVEGVENDEIPVSMRGFVESPGRRDYAPSYPMQGSFGQQATTAAPAVRGLVGR